MSVQAQLPWHHKQWQNIVARYSADNLPHALLIAGPSGTGKNQFALRFAQFLLCEKKGKTQHEACGQCQSCHWFSAQTHPDFSAITPLEGKSSISINQIRELVSSLNHTSSVGGYKVIVIHGADNMTTAAANALLKTLEEPAGAVVFMLVTDQLSVLPATIISRCQLINIPEPSKEVAIAWLKDNLTDSPSAGALLDLADGRVMLAKEYSEKDVIKIADEQLTELNGIKNGSHSAVSVAAKWQKADPVLQLECLTILVMNMIRSKMLGIDNTPIKKLVLSCGEHALLNYYSLVRKKLVLLKSKSNPNPQLLLEGLLTQFQMLVRHEA